ncbi:MULTISPECIES: N-acetyl-gamma-glutamyl-phosphate reductase [Bifidobacterium]|uniref:N-acetyl-gamma-glutamyl-phosphate reductase n=1 Tax=Bifidobacterium apousia TaxID=2750996 RepID=A0A556R283_9BIFI|nr:MULTISPECIES: N-acetyl-gamma-glutamyl-phosphate reductase [Bifidobacterium]MBI0062586.1 N-acetyl-gamma-glutamyl-phosphate reductase [Bifidobacterium apousia]MBI0071005.1 N-acetyl-gamma-glutamyl-phosphate reductase [Bifidobacterium sp. W8112]MBI0123997.1 N-acetyl-gamma-glutamyl-phosphate reductase [Bifidobacterium apousia]MBI0137509.1 N-acetyl-gamma-glutamyl-phosphate reductase [Bifidobacterium sp. W8120]TSJ82967.1 N-acetyl-gamma-glutamyl-phosphate reductase [Bifidobacterium apousia]
MRQYTVAVAGASGYAGSEMIRLLAAHPAFQVCTVTGHGSAGRLLGEFSPNLPESLASLQIQDTKPDILAGHDLVVLALPHGASGPLAEQLDPQSLMVDLGADHRLEDPGDWQDYYGGPFSSPWTYGMPELLNPGGGRQRQLLGQTHRIAGPGCNVTAVTLAFQPALSAGLVQTDDLVADLAVGYSGAGRSSGRMDLLAAQAINSAHPYSVGGTHRHIPEILQNLRKAAAVDPSFAQSQKPIRLGLTPILVPMSRGILAVVSARLSALGRSMGMADIRAVWEGIYAKEPFVDLLPEGKLPSTADVYGSNRAQVQVAVDQRADRLYAFAAIDNLTRGTAGQALQAVNLALGLPEETGLTTIGVAP